MVKNLQQFVFSLKPALFVCNCIFQNSYFTICLSVFLLLDNFLLDNIYICLSVCLLSYLWIASIFVCLYVCYGCLSSNVYFMCLHFCLSVCWVICGLHLYLSVCMLVIGVLVCYFFAFLFVCLSMFDCLFVLLLLRLKDEFNQRKWKLEITLWKSIVTFRVCSSYTFVRFFRFKNDLFYVNLILTSVSTEKIHVLQRNTVTKLK